MHYRALRSQNVVHHSREQGKVNNSKMGQNYTKIWKILLKFNKESFLSFASNIK